MKKNLLFENQFTRKAVICVLVSLGSVIYKAKSLRKKIDIVNKFDRSKTNCI